LGHEEEAVQLLSKAMTLSPGGSDPHVNLELHLNLAVSLRQLGRFGDAEQELHKALRLDEDDFGVHTNLGEIYLFMGDHAKAVNSLRRAISLNPQASMKAHALLGILLRAINPQEARAAFEAALATSDPYQSNFATSETRAIALLALGEPGAASAQLQTAIPYRTPSDTFRKPIYERLRQPKLIGIEHLLAAWEKIITQDPAAARPFHWFTTG
jgi:tetratricopeptide (TPR) repeat protein